MKTQHTPGPWKAIDQTNSGDGLNIKDSNGIHIAHTAVHASQLDKIRGNTWENAHANAYLIAAAPELVEALESLLNYAEDVAAENDERPSCIDVAREAIKKAKGL